MASGKAVVDGFLLLPDGNVGRFEIPPGLMHFLVWRGGRVDFNNYLLAKWIVLRLDAFGGSPSPLLACLQPS